MKQARTTANVIDKIVINDLRLFRQMLRHARDKYMF
jgi:hypothetical protein